MSVRTTYAMVSEDSKTRKRRSLNLPLKVGTWDSEDLERSFGLNTCASPQKSGHLMSPLDCSSDKRSSFHALLDEENQLQQQLQELARSENARLSPESSASEIRDLGIPSVPTTPLDSDFQKSIFEKQSGAAFPVELRSPVYQAGTPDSVDRSFHGRDYPKNSGVSSLPNSPNQARHRRISINRAKRWAQKSSSMYVIGPQDVEKLYSGVDSIISEQNRENSPSKNAHENPVYGPSRPGNIQGEALSWQMAGELFRLTTFSQDKTLLHAPRSNSSLYDYARFFWCLYSDPVIFKHGVYNIPLVPPEEVIAKLRPNSASFNRLGQLIIRLLCAIASFLILAIQMLLLLFMILAYGMGSALFYPIQKTGMLFSGKHHKKQRVDHQKIQKLKKKLKS